MKSLLLMCALVAVGDDTPPQPVAVRHPDGPAHGFFSLRTLGGGPLWRIDLVAPSWAK